MKLWPIGLRVMLDFDSSPDEWWLPDCSAWRHGVSAGVAACVLGLRLGLCVELYDDDAVDADFDDDEPWCEICRCYHPASTPHVDELGE